MIAKNSDEVNKYQLVLVEGEAKKSSPTHPTLTGRSDGNKRCVFDVDNIALLDNDSEAILHEQFQSLVDMNPSSHSLQRRLPLPGDYVIFMTSESKGQTLYGKALAITSLMNYQSLKKRVENCN